MSNETNADSWMNDESVLLEYLETVLKNDGVAEMSEALIVEWGVEVGLNVSDGADYHEDEELFYEEWKPMLEWLKTKTKEILNKKENGCHVYIEILGNFWNWCSEKAPDDDERNW